MSVTKSSLDVPVSETDSALPLVFAASDPTLSKSYRVPYHPTVASLLVSVAVR